MTIDGNRISGAFSNKSHFAAEDGSKGSSPLGTNHYMLRTAGGGKNTILHDLGAEEKFGWPLAADVNPVANNLTFLILGKSIGGICPLQASFISPDC
jgi:hypothetical protein